MEKFSFKRGWSQIKQCDAPVVKKKIMKAIKINSRNAFYERLCGKVEHRITEHQAIEQIFAEYGVTDVLGLETVTMAVD